MKRQDFISGIRRKVDGNPGVVYMGIDWGRSNEPTSICILRDEGNCIVTEHVDMEHSNIRNAIENIGNLIKKKNAKSVVGDIASNSIQAQMLQSIVGDRFKTCYYSPNVGGVISYNRDHWMYSVDKAEISKQAREIANNYLSEDQMHALNYAYVAYIGEKRFGEKNENISRII